MPVSSDCAPTQQQHHVSGDPHLSTPLMIWYRALAKTPMDTARPVALARTSGVRTAGCQSGSPRRRTAVAARCPSDMVAPPRVPTVTSSAILAKKPAARVPAVYDL